MTRLACGHTRDNLVKGNMRRTDEGDCATCLMHDEIERLTRERDELASEVTDLHMVAQSIKHYWQCDPAAGIPCVRCQRDGWKARVEAAERKLTDRAQCCMETDEIRRVLIAFHRQEGEGILAVKRLAKRLYEQTAGGARRPAESPADYPDGPPSPPSGISFGGTE